METLGCNISLLLLQAFLLFLILLLTFSSPFTEKRVDVASFFSTFETRNVRVAQFFINASSSPPQVSSSNFSLATALYNSSINKFYKARSIRVEEDLAQARAAIRKAIHLQNYTSHSHRTETSHTEMVKKFKVWIYKEGEHPTVHIGPMHNKYAIEGQFIDEMESKNNPFRASHPDEAHAFFLPVSVANVVQYVYQPITTVKDYSRDRLQRLLTDYVTVVADKYPYWNRSNGADHFMVSCHDWAPEISKYEPELFKNFIRVLCNANNSEGFQPRSDVSMPEIYLPFGRLGPPNMGQTPNYRPIFSFFSGRPNGNIRKLLFNHWKDRDNEVRVYKSLPKGYNYTKMMGQSKFCLCPSGFEVASPREVEAIYAGCVPVVISDNYTLPFSDVLNWSQFSIQIPSQKIPEIKNILKAIPNEKYLKMYKRVNRVKRHFMLNRPAKPFDVMHMVLHSVWLRRLNFRLATLSQ
ncbi:putative glycosyltransferase [Citrus sinensis]|nr:putative glycosyltransferase [Citrus sinensis]